MNDHELMTTVKDSFADVHADPPVERSRIPPGHTC